VAACGLAPARTLVFALFNAEEAGLIGSATYVDDPPYPLDQIAAMFSLDMVGAGDGTGLILYGTTKSRLAWLADLMEGASAEAGLPYAVVRADALDLSDHVYFYYAGVPAVFGFTIGDHDGYHTPADTIDHIRLEDLTASSAMMWATLVPLALGTEADYLGKRAFFRAAETLGPLPDLDRERHPIR
jgi:Zn-dependent M28 family amino/carboxypeptidase